MKKHNMEKETLIKIEHLKKTFNNVDVIKDLTVDLNAGDRIALIGQNGAGKTTLIRCILGLYTFEGYLSVLGKSPRTDREKVLQEVGFVPQLPPPLKMTVAEIMEFFSIITKTDQEKFIQIANDLKLDVSKHLHKPFLKLSGGMKQKLLVSLALARNPKILLMDEPSANLDPEARIVLFNYLKNLPEDTLMILSSHRVDEIEDLVNRLIEMDLGEIIIDKTLKPVLS